MFKLGPENFCLFDSIWKWSFLEKKNQQYCEAKYTWNSISFLIVSFALILFSDSNCSLLKGLDMASKLNSFISFSLCYFQLPFASQFSKIHHASECFFFNFLSVYTHDIEQKTHTHVPLTGVMCNIRKTPHNQLCRQAHETLLYGTRVFVPEKNSWSWMEG